MWSILWKKVNIMETIQIVLDKKLLLAADQAARRTKRNRSALVRDALREHLQRLKMQAEEARDREGYLQRPQVYRESLPWEAEAAWPAE
jgi:metal-responsive CopG/Arc/MetJ family transcriptional regulator